MVKFALSIVLRLFQPFVVSVRMTGMRSSGIPAVFRALPAS
jgi:hypothetical protein